MPAAMRPGITTPDNTLDGSVGPQGAALIGELRRLQTFLEHERLTGARAISAHHRGSTRQPASELFASARRSKAAKASTARSTAFSIWSASIGAGRRSGASASKAATFASLSVAPRREGAIPPMAQRKVEQIALRQPRENGKRSRRRAAAHHTPETSPAFLCRSSL